MEIGRQLGWSRQRAELYHYRTRDQVEVDIALENRRGQVVAIDVKASSTVRADDFRGLRHLADRLGDDLVVGIVLYTGQETLPFGPRFRAVPSPPSGRPAEAGEDTRWVCTPSSTANNHADGAEATTASAAR
jgi:hypothetical protein